MKSTKEKVRFKMLGLGTIVNTIAVVVGGIFGTIFGNKITRNLQDMLMKAMGIAVLFIGISGTLQYMFVLKDGKVTTQGTMLLILSLALGGLLGELIGIERQIERPGEWLKQKINRKNDGYFVDGFVNTALLICVGAMGMVGSIQDGLTGDTSMLFAKAAIDIVLVMVNASIFGIGAAFAALPMFLYQGLITLIASGGSNFIGAQLIENLSMVGASLIFCIGINLIWGKKINVGNMIPALLVPIIYGLIVS